MNKSIKSKLPTKLTARTIVAMIVFIFLATAPLYLSSFRVNMFGKYMCFALVALAIDMIWGYTGILSLGHGVYFGIGAYCMGMYLKLESSNGALPDFMSWSGMTELPAFWKPFASPVFTILMVLILPIFLASIIGSLTFLNRIKGVYFCIISQALAYVLATFMIGKQEYFGGSNGLTSFYTIFGHSLNDSTVKMVIFYATLLALIVSFILCNSIIKRRTGRILIAIRDAESRARFTGYSTASYKVFVYCLSAVLTSIAGALYVTQVGIISPSDIGIAPSTEMVVWVAVGGRGTLIGPIIGALVMNYAKSLISESFPSIWQFFIGGIFMIVVLFLPKGLVSVKDVVAKIKKKSKNKKLPKEENE